MTCITGILFLKSTSGIIEQPAPMTGNCNPPRSPEIDCIDRLQGFSIDYCNSVLEMFCNVKSPAVRRKCKTLRICTRRDSFKDKAAADTKMIRDRYSILYHLILQEFSLLHQYQLPIYNQLRHWK